MQLELTKQGTLKLPRELRERTGIRPGDHLEVTMTRDGEIRLRVKHLTLSGLSGLLETKRNGKQASLEEIAKTIEDGWTGDR